ncbi:MAG: DUF433 domain-containing protein [Deltaproteobacteria bacterium]|nr:DUF433 domain-containing protein [Deltaproteobacteria bacterium]
MSTEPSQVVEVQQTEHPYIVRVPGICGGRPTIKGTRITVQLIAELYKVGDSVEEMLQGYPHLPAAAVYDAISYYLDHQPEIEQAIVNNRLEALIAKHDLTMDEQGVLHFSKATTK